MSSLIHEWAIGGCHGIELKTHKPDNKDQTRKHGLETLLKGTKKDTLPQRSTKIITKKSRKCKY